MNKLDPKIITVQDVITNDDLNIPEYQRPYKWTLKNVNQLIDDIFTHKQKSSYRLGTLVIHKEQKDGKTISNIVDGQQRTISLSLIAYAIYENFQKEIQEDAQLKSIDFDKLKILNIPFQSDITLFNIQNNYREISRRIRQFDISSIRFFFEKCELVQIELDDISEAFQFFDSQNSRGKDLEPHDLLKAFHLREMQKISTAEKLKAVEAWEEMNSNELAFLFENYLFRIRNWSKGFSARYFSKEEVDVFKGISFESKKNYPYSRIYRIGHFFTDNYNKDYQRNIDLNKADFPFQLDQIIINGKRFFEMIMYYNNIISNTNKLKKEAFPNFKKVIEVLETYEGRNRTGDSYVRTLFDCALIYYIDKYGIDEIELVIDKIFVWAYSLRMKLQAVQIASMDNHALEDNIFKAIRESLEPKRIMNYNVKPIEKNDSTKTEKIYEHFKQLKYAQ
ncbi:hypothetical protein J2X31_003688 [Flavobacterium arsenatis]|uniref:DUF262 domain-containing protein n=1 Tax=Flavobacterium arsenatis TaxID=1484332 RepID=A0ABU1TUU6_9FLAO|nr:DUF262 domain-containing protein [Flavobacterium arsenatis]MDR6969654.1 hypothetical protein [Flavobacterium arsenatis]